MRCYVVTLFFGCAIESSLLMLVPSIELLSISLSTHGNMHHIEEQHMAATSVRQMPLSVSLLCLSKVELEKHVFQSWTKFE
jgi:hypothetical protein